MRNRWHYSTEWKLRFIQNVASCYVVCLKKESVNTATLVHAPACICVPRTPHGGLSDTSALEIRSGGGSGLNSLPVRIRNGIRTLRSAALMTYYVHGKYTTSGHYPIKTRPEENWSSNRAWFLPKYFFSQFLSPEKIWVPYHCCLLACLWRLKDANFEMALLSLLNRTATFCNIDTVIGLNWINAEITLA